MQQDTDHLKELLARELAAFGLQLESTICTAPGAILFLGKQPILNRDVAVKVLHGGPEDETAKQRFAREAKILSDFDHPNIVKFLGAGTLSNGGSYFLMEHLNGTSLRTCLEEGNLPGEEKVRFIGASIAEALAYSHDRKIVHRDVKPENIMLMSDLAGEQAKLIDFGIHKSTDPRQQGLTQTGCLTGTANYMSPEQCRGAIVDSSSDIYSLGCVLYELVCGSAPMEAESDWMILNNHLNRDVIFVPSSAISKDLEAIICKCLKKNPEERWKNANELATALSADFQPRKASPFNKVALAAGCSLVFLVCIFVGRPWVATERTPAKLPTIQDRPMRVQDRSVGRMPFDQCWDFLRTQKFEKQSMLARQWLVGNQDSQEWVHLGMMLGRMPVVPEVGDQALFTKLLSRTDKIWTVGRKRLTTEDELFALARVRLYCQRVTGSQTCEKTIDDVMSIRPYSKSLEEPKFQCLSIALQSDRGIEAKLRMVTKYVGSFESPAQKAYLYAVSTSCYYWRHEYPLSDVEADKCMEQLLKPGVNASTISEILGILVPQSTAKPFRRYLHENRLVRPNECSSDELAIYASLVDGLMAHRMYSQSREILTKMQENPDAQGGGDFLEIKCRQIRIALATRNKQKVMDYFREFDKRLPLSNVNPRLIQGIVLDITKTFPEEMPTVLRTLNRDDRAYAPGVEGAMSAHYAHYLKEQGNLAEAVKYFEQSRKLLSANPTVSFCPELAASLLEEATIYLQNKDPDKALPLLEAAMRYSQSNVQRLYILGTQATAFQRQNKLEDATRLHRQVMEQSRGSAPQLFVVATGELVRDLLMQKKFAQAREVANANLPLFHLNNEAENTWASRIKKLLNKTETADEAVSPEATTN